MLNDVMVDIETFGTDSNAVIVSISAVQCNMETGETGKHFEIGIDLKEQMDSGAVMEADTVLWWLTQAKEAQDQLTALDRESVHTVLYKFNEWLKSVFCNSFWGNGATFDNVTIRNLYKRHNVTFVVPFWADRCVRTRVADKGINTKDYNFIGIKHRGIDDCLHQIKYCTGDK